MFLDSKAIAVASQVKHGVLAPKCVWLVTITLDGVELARKTFAHNHSMCDRSNANEHVWALCEDMGVDCDLVGGAYVLAPADANIAGSITYTQKPWF